jgi:hypothetical protein
MNNRRLRRRLIIAGALVAITLVAALAVPAARPSRAAETASQARAVGTFDRVKTSGAFTTSITAGARAVSVTVSGDGDDVSRVTTEVRDGTLEVSMKPGNSSFAQAPKIDITVPVLRGFENEGAGTVTIAGVKGGDFSIANSGTATITATGRAAKEDIALNGTGKIDVTGIDARDVTVDNNGVGSVRVRASGELTMSVNGIGEIRYAGNPTAVHSSVNGIGRISRM